MNEKEKFLRNELFSLAVQAAFRTRNKNFPIFGNASESKREEMKNEMKGWLDGIFDSSKEINSDQIEAFRENFSKKFPSLLYDGKFRFGIAQKLFCVYLKYLWCAGLYKKIPNVCPVDGKVINKWQAEYTKNNNGKKIPVWTGNGFSTDIYNEIILLIKNTEKKSVAEWELIFFEEERGKSKTVTDM